MAIPDRGTDALRYQTFDGFDMKIERKALSGRSRAWRSHVSPRSAPKRIGSELTTYSVEKLNSPPSRRVVAEIRPLRTAQDRRSALG